MNLLSSDDEQGGIVVRALVSCMKGLWSESHSKLDGALAYCPPNSIWVLGKLSQLGKYLDTREIKAAWEVTGHPTSHIDDPGYVPPLTGSPLCTKVYGILLIQCS